MSGAPELSWLRSRLMFTPPTEHMSFSLWKDMIWGLAGSHKGYAREGEQAKGRREVDAARNRR